LQGILASIVDLTYKPGGSRRPEILKHRDDLQGYAMKRGLKTVLLLSLGVLAGLGSAGLVLKSGGLGAGMGSQTVDGWTGNHLTGAKAADPYTRGIVAKSGLLALTQAEAMYFTRSTDSDGQPLRASCVYALEGGPMPARWWSVTIYDAQDYLPVNGDDAQSVDMTRTAAQASPNGRWTARVAADQAGAADWISSKNAGNFSLTLRLYNPQDAARSNFAAIPFPTLKTVSCAKGAA
jgi:hypothetical protein